MKGAEKERSEATHVEPSPSRDRVLLVHGAYTTFVAAGVVSLISGDGHIKTEGWAICFWALSLPPLASYLLLDYIVRVSQKRRNSAARP